MLEYAIVIGIAVFLVGIGILAPVFAGKKTDTQRKKLAVIFDLAGTAAEEVEQAFKVRPENETPEEKKARQEKMLALALDKVKLLALEFGFKVPSDVVLKTVINSAVFGMNHAKKMLEK